MILELAALNSSSTGSVAPVTITVTATPSATAESASKYSSAEKASSSPPSLSTGTTIGLAVGIPIALFALGILGYLFYRQRSINRNIALQAGANDMQPMRRQPSSVGSFYASQAPYSPSSIKAPPPPAPRHEVPG
jgi:hypothetical protein